MRFMSERKKGKIKKIKKPNIHQNRDGRVCDQTATLPYPLSLYIYIPDRRHPPDPTRPLSGALACMANLRYAAPRPTSPPIALTLLSSLHPNCEPCEPCEPTS